MQGKCIILSAPSGAGKTTIVKNLLQKPELKLEFSISACNRQPRPGEVDGRDYYFISTDLFKNKILDEEFVEWEEVYKDNFYGTLKSELNRIWSNNNIATFEVDVKGGLKLKRLFNNNALAIYIMPPSIEVLEKRLKNRGTEADEIIHQRLARAKFELSLAPQFDITIVNNVLEQSIEEAYHQILKFVTVS